MRRQRHFPFAFRFTIELVCRHDFLHLLPRQLPCDAAGTIPASFLPSPRASDKITCRSKRAKVPVLFPKLAALVCIQSGWIEISASISHARRCESTQAKVGTKRFHFCLRTRFKDSFGFHKVGRRIRHPNLWSVRNKFLFCAKAINPARSVNHHADNFSVLRTLPFSPFPRLPTRF